MHTSQYNNINIKITIKSTIEYVIYNCIFAQVQIFFLKTRNKNYYYTHMPFFFVEDDDDERNNEY